MARLSRQKKREIRAAVNKSIAAQVRTLGLTDALYELGETSEDIVAYAEQWRETLANGIARVPNEETQP